MSSPIALFIDKHASALSDSERRGAQALPTDLLDKARQRLTSLALLLSVLSVLGVTMDTSLVLSGYMKLHECAADGGAALMTFVFYALVRSRRLSTPTALTIGLAYEVIACLAMSVTLTPVLQDRFGHPPVFTPAYVLIVVFPLIVPARPKRALLTSIAAAAMDPLGRWLVDLTGYSDTPATIYFASSVLGVCSVALAVAGARIIYSTNLAVAEARTLGSYRLRALLGRGGMGEVWRATHRLLARPAAIKLIRPEILGDEAHTHDLQARFAREAQATAALHSPYTVRLYDFGVTRDGTFYFAMELLDGLTLDAAIARFGPMPAERAIHILLQLCDSLADAHYSNMIHRDIKPANVMLCRMGHRVDHVKVLDFGLVALMQDRSRGAASDSGAGADADTVVGTPAFIAPEVAQSHPRVDHRVDLYAVGCIAYWLLTGRLVFQHASAMAMILAHVDDPPEPPSEHAPHPIPAELDALVLACLAKSPDARPATATELARQLAAIPLDAPWTAERAHAWWDEHRPARDTDDDAHDDGADNVHDIAQVDASPDVTSVDGGVDPNADTQACLTLQSIPAATLSKHLR